MKLSANMLRRLIAEECECALRELDSSRFLHGEDPSDSEGGMAMGKLSSMVKMAEEVASLLDHNDQLPGWVQDHISVAHENLQQVHGYLTNR
jgi:hypothetical protein